MVKLPIIIDSWMSIGPVQTVSRTTQENHLEIAFRGNSIDYFFSPCCLWRLSFCIFKVPESRHQLEPLIRGGSLARRESLRCEIYKGRWQRKTYLFLFSANVMSVRDGKSGERVALHKWSMVSVLVDLVLQWGIFFMQKVYRWVR